MSVDQFFPCNLTDHVGSDFNDKAAEPISEVIKVSSNCGQLDCLYRCLLSLPGLSHRPVTRSRTLTSATTSLERLQGFSWERHSVSGHTPSLSLDLTNLLYLSVSEGESEVLQTLNLSWNNIRRKGAVALANGLKVVYSSQHRRQPGPTSIAPDMNNTVVMSFYRVEV